MSVRMSVRCKFKCASVTKRKHWDINKGFIYDAEFAPVTGGSPENESFWAASPGGSFKIASVVEPSFEPGKEYYLDITLAE